MNCIEHEDSELFKGLVDGLIPSKFVVFVQRSPLAMQYNATSGMKGCMKLIIPRMFCSCWMLMEGPISAIPCILADQF